MSKIWPAIHAITVALWGYMLASLLWELFSKGNLSSEPSKGGNYYASFVVFFLALLLTTCASGIRALWLEAERDL